MIKIYVSNVLIFLILSLSTASVFGEDISDVKRNGLLRHLGIPYSNFVTGSGDGFSIELIQGFAKYLGVKYTYVQTSWANVIRDLSGKKVRPIGDDVKILGNAPIRGDVVATGLTILPWREKVIDYSTPTFPTQIWLLTSADSPLQPIKPTGNITNDIELVKSILKGISVLGVPDTCLDPNLYGLEESGAKVILFQGEINMLSPAVIRGDAETCIYEVPDALNAIKKWPGRLKVIGPLSKDQVMGCGFRKSSPELRKAFNQYLIESKRNGFYFYLVKKYYEDALLYFPNFFKQDIH